MPNISTYLSSQEFSHFQEMLFLASVLSFCVALFLGALISVFFLYKNVQEHFLPLEKEYKYASFYSIFNLLGSFLLIMMTNMQPWLNDAYAHSHPFRAVLATCSLSFLRGFASGTLLGSIFTITMLYIDAQKAKRIKHSSS